MRLGVRWRDQPGWKVGLKKRGISNAYQNNEVAYRVVNSPVLAPIAELSFYRRLWHYSQRYRGSYPGRWGAEILVGVGFPADRGFGKSDSAG
jgi:hypothetical protein